MFILGTMIFSLSVAAQDKEKKEEEKKPAYVFEMDYEVKHTSVKHQGRTGTCWCFATLSFLEAEILRMGMDEVDLSEMYIVQNAYPQKAMSYIRLHGSTNFAQGGQGHDVIDQMRLAGIVPEEAYNGMNINEKRHNHGEMASILRSMLDTVLKRRGGKVTPRWMEAFEAVLDIYMGEVPEKFEYKGKTYTPESFLKNYLKFNLDDYIEITSYSQYPLYDQCRLELPDNWTFNDRYYNVPVEDLDTIVDYSLKNGYSVAWSGDVSNKDFSTSKTGYGIVPVKDWEDKTKEEREKKVTEPVEEKVITQDMRQKAFNNFSSTDDHGMHIVGLAHDQNGNKFYYTKNSHGTDRKYDGYVYLSKPYIELHMTTIMVNKNGLPPDIQKKLGIK
jgi:bleomycin hydrolase